MTQLSIKSLRKIAIANTLSPLTTIKGAIDGLGFLQADPIRNPARAQDLILRHRAKGYKAGDLERLYPKLDLDEDFLFAYGFLNRSLTPLLYPKTEYTLSDFERRICDYVAERDTVHPQDLEATFGSERTRNAWGGFSKATKRALERLHHHGYLRVSGRHKGIRLYQKAPDMVCERTPQERFRALAGLIATFHAPVDRKTLQRALNCLKHIVPKSSERRELLEEVLSAQGFQSQVLDGIEYLWQNPESSLAEPKSLVRFLAPFDPLVRDRERFEHLWGWTYRFEAYTPVAKRQRGYYALPLLWRDDVIGWVNAKVEGELLDLEVGYVRQAPKSRVYQRALEAEAARMASFLHLPRDSWEIRRFK